ncbi:MAG: glycosyltransferase family 9 protein [Chloroflexi bacterium]|nr:glycosyltransferase family 9 protein [Chloroflexota bacterium]
MDTRWRDVTNVLLLRLDSLGDVLVTTPAIHAVRANLPAARISLLASSVGAEAGYLNPDVDDVIVYSAPWMDANRVLAHDSEREFDVVRRLSQRNFDGAIIFTSYHQSSLPAAYLCYLAGIPLRHAASTDGSGSLLTSRHRHPPQIVHEVEHGLDLVAGLGFPADKKDLVLRPRPGDHHRATELVEALRIKNDRPLVVIHPGCSVQARTYPWGSYVKVADLLVERLGCQVLWTGMPGEVDLVERIRSWTKWPTHSLAGHTNLGTLAAIISQSDLLITNNTGPMHVSAAMKTPVVALFALTNPPEQWGPWMVSHRILNEPTPCAYCYARTCTVGHQCLTLVSADKVVEAAESLLRERARLGSKGTAAARATRTSPS